MGAIDIHFHGAFGIDLMTARTAELDELAMQLARAGIMGFCPTTLSVPFPKLVTTVSQLGKWITAVRSQHSYRGALPLGIHLEGPYIHPEACGAHPPEAIRPLRFDELEMLWEASHGTLKILTLAPERLTAGERRRLVQWTTERRIVLSLGHSRATEHQAETAFNEGFRGVTHAWNALAFHHRTPGAMGAALGRKDVVLELILDGVHVSPAVSRWTRDLHGNQRICYVSDCVPAAATAPGKWSRFGSLRVRYADGACRTANGHLAGGGILLTDAFATWIQLESASSGRPLEAVLRSEIPSLTATPLRYLRLDRQTTQILKRPRLEWIIHEADGLQRRTVF